MKKLLTIATVVMMIFPSSAQADDFSLEFRLQLPGFDLLLIEPPHPTYRPYYYRDKNRLRHFRVRHENYCYRRYRSYNRKNNTFRANRKRRMKCWSPFLQDARKYGYRK